MGHNLPTLVKVIKCIVGLHIHLSTLDTLENYDILMLFFFSPKVNKDFGSIFSTLLPGANAMLAPPEGQTVLDGLEFKVALGNTWKENLTELSGGQR